MVEIKEIKYDIVDLYMKLEKDFPTIEFITQDEFINGKTIHRFMIRNVYQTEYNPPIKTTIIIEKNSEISDLEYQKIFDNVKLAFLK